MQLQIRPVTESVFTEALALQAYSLRSLSTEYYNPQQIEAIVKSQERVRRREFRWKGELIYGGWIDQQLVAIAAISTWGGSIGGIYVHPDFARFGIGRQMALKLEEVAIERRCRDLTVISSLIAVRLYESVGYSRVFSDKLRFGEETVACIFLAKSLPRPKPKKDRRFETLTAIFSVVICLAVVATFM